MAFIAGGNLVSGIDNRLVHQLAAIQTRPDVLPGLAAEGVGDLDNDGDARRFDAPLLVWIRAPGNVAYQSDATATLPAALHATTGPGQRDHRRNGDAARGRPARHLPSGTGWITIAQTTAEATNARNTLIVAELLIAPALLLLVFIGALAIGRRVAAPHRAGSAGTARLHGRCLP